VYLYSRSFSFQIIISQKWGFTKWNREVFEEMKEAGKLTNDGCNVQYRPDHGPLFNWKKLQLELRQTA
jgi:large subunit ribosomal protein L10e